MTGTTTDGAMFQGEFGRTYAFYSVATDNVGFIEAAPLVPDAVTATASGLGSIGDRVWLDLDGNGIQDAGEPGMPGVVVRLLAADRREIAVTTTDHAGFYRFDDVPGEREVYVAFERPAGFLFSRPNAVPDGTRDSDVDPRSGRTPAFTVFSGEQADWDAGLHQAASIRGRLFDDLNGNGKQEEEEMAIAGWTVFLDTNGNGTWEDGEPFSLTDNDGLYDLLVGEKVGNFGKIRLYLNQGGQTAFQFDEVRYVQAQGRDLTVPAAGCLGVFPVVTDFDGDGRKDLLVGLADGRVQVLLNANTDADPQFTTGSFLEFGQAGAKTEIDVGSRATLSFVDWNGDGDELAALAQQDVIVVASAGNGYATFDSQLGVAYPAADPNTISVGAVWDSNHGGPWSFGSQGTDYTTGTDRVTVFSQRHGALLDVFAPGGGITGADAYGGETTMSGTSQAAPYVTGAAVLVQQLAFETLGRRLTTHEFRALLAQTGQSLVDGDDEDDSVVNSDLSFPRIDMVELARAIGHLDPEQPNRGGDGANSIRTGSEAGVGWMPTQLHAQPYSHSVRLVSGELRESVDFANKYINSAPVAITEDTAKVAEDNEHRHALQATDVDGDSVIFEVVGHPLHGQVQIAGNTAVYNPDENWFGQEILRLRGFDGYEHGNEVRVTITVQSVNDPPTANDDSDQTERLLRL